MIPMLLFRITGGQPIEPEPSVAEGDASQQTAVTGDASTQSTEGEASKG